MQRHCEEYAKALAFAVAFWAGREGLVEKLQMMPDLEALVASCQQWDGGSPTNELFLPRRIQGPRLALQSGPPVSLPLAQASSTAANAATQTTTPRRKRSGGGGLR